MLWCYYYQYCLICFGALFTAHPVYSDFLTRLIALKNMSGFEIHIGKSKVLHLQAIYK